MAKAKSLDEVACHLVAKNLLCSCEHGTDTRLGVGCALICAITVLIITAKLLHAITPLGTSLASFAVGFASSDPLKDQIKAAQQVRSYIKEVIITKKAAISEREDMAKESRDFMLALEDDLYHSFTKKIKSEIIVIKQYAYNMLMRKLKDPNSLTAITKKAEATNQDFDDSKPSDHAYRLLKGEADAEPTDESDNQ